MTFWTIVLVFMFALPRGHGEGFFSRLTNKGRNGNNQPDDFVNVCETVRIMPRIAMAVVGGAPLRVETSAPYIAAVGERTENGSVSWFCGGSLVSPQHILTAAHCLVSRNVSTVRLGSFSTKKRSTENDYEVSETIIHPEYKITQSYNDIGILKVKDKVSLDNNIKPICLPQNNENYEKERAKVIGWGAEEFGGEGTQKLQQVEVEVFSNANCEKAYSNSTIAPKTFPKGIKDSQLCAGSKKGGKDACQGDSGGPLVLTDEQGIVRQIGIVSTGAGCGFKMYPGVYTRVSSYTDWIQKQIKSSSQKDSKEDSSKKNARPSTDNQQQGTLLSIQSIHNSSSKNKTNSRPPQKEKYSSAKKNHNSREVYPESESQNGGGRKERPHQVDKNSREVSPGSSSHSGSPRKQAATEKNSSKQVQNSREVYPERESQNGGSRKERPHQADINSSKQIQNSREVSSGSSGSPRKQAATDKNSSKQIQNSREVYPESESRKERPHQPDKNSSKQIQNSREVYSGSDCSRKENSKISGTNSIANSISSSRKTEHGSREVFPLEKGQGKPENLIQTNSQHHRVRRFGSRHTN